ncbi:ABC transporter permease [Paracoccus shanxieyensis]|uniref:ABC transporter permease subunit n=1 Tax=Paracoccus shanxieyensis TaxID=2675752 RepID=A0A6L6J1P6_9RHOB|nr:ABC transporter permease [Paracoccus shanxieyensis]MTH66675.1 ABC transporter permease subunit [Paracoccus shanxieyensis]MTH89910.1 ABC transporter permease subunit [Paracoccus shanxieyensis]
MKPSPLTGPMLILPATVLLLAGFLAPTAIMAMLSLRDYTAGSGIGNSWTLANYLSVLGDGFYLEIVARSLALGFLVTFACLILGFPLALFILRSSPRVQTAAILLVIFPLLCNIVVRSFGWMVLLAPNGVINAALMASGIISAPLDLMYNLTGVVIGLTQIYVPFMALLLIPALQNIPPDVEAAAFTLKASRARVFFTVTIPLAIPGIITGSILVFVLSISALVTPRMLGGPTYKVMATQIYDEFMTNLNWPAGAALAFILTALALALIWAANRISAYFTRGIST